MAAGAYGNKRSGFWLETEAGGGKRGGVNTTISQKRDAQGTGHQSAEDGGGERRVGDSTMGPSMLYFLLHSNLGRP